MTNLGLGKRDGVLDLSLSKPGSDKVGSQQARGELDLPLDRPVVANLGLDSRQVWE